MNTTTTRSLFDFFTPAEFDAMSLEQMRTAIAVYVRVIAWLTEAIPNGPTFEDRLAMVDACSRLTSIKFCLESWAKARAEWTAEGVIDIVAPQMTTPAPAYQLAA
jgi:hypothetical protein